MPKIRAALLSAPAASGEGVFLRIDELDEAEITACHLPAVTECDLPPWRYYWVPSPRGGAFWPLVSERAALAVQAARNKEDKSR